MAEPHSTACSELSDYVARMRRNAAAQRHRAVLVMSGKADWCREAASALMGEFTGQQVWWLGNAVTAGAEKLAWSHARTRLGMEVDSLVIDSFDGFDAEGFGALSGTVRAGGLLLLLAPPLEQWRSYADPQLQRLALYPYSAEQLSGYFLQRLAKVVSQVSGVVVYAQGGSLPPLPDIENKGSLAAADDVYATAGQRDAVESIRRVAEGHRHRPLVLSADRGRGKSAALGIAAAQLLHQGVGQIVVTAPRIDAAAQIFNHAERLLPGCERRRSELLWQGGEIVFVPPDALLHTPRHSRLLLVDEAAAIPTPMLEGLLQQYARIVFATTVHGYEGTGRGFAVRFHKVLSERTPQWQALRLVEPIRWAEGDPLEALSFSALMLDAEPVAEEVVAAASVIGSECERLLPGELAGNERDLCELFGLLVLAHYRTSPNDLRQLLDGPQQSIYVMRHAGHIVGAALVVREGKLEPSLANEIYLGRRRVQGHLLPQSLANHAGFPEAAGLGAARVMRIVVHPALQGRGLGRTLLQYVEQEERGHGCDYLGASFGATAALLQFWLDQGFLPMRVGLSREASSGTHSVMVMKPLSGDGEALFCAVRERFAETLPEWLAQPLDDLEGELSELLLSTTPPQAHEAIGEQDRRDLTSFAYGLRGYELCMLAIRKLVVKAVADSSWWLQLDETQQQLLLERVMQRHDWAKLVRDNGLDGRKQAQSLLRHAVSRLLEYSGSA